jgi:hypothetical protein
LVSAKIAAIYFEGPFLAASLMNVSSSDPSVPTNYASMFVTPAFMRARNVRMAPNTGRIGANKGAAQFGGGLDFGTPLRILFPINLRVEVRDIYSGKPNYNGNTS